ncbi:polymer-forming cytoskeletal protein [Photobacterium rosenbergii]|nr:polymer-forming cytoskeletal protein [Photobacterium rosenbergii]
MGIFNKQSGAASQQTTTTVIAAGCDIHGELKLSCDMQVDGNIDGTLKLDKGLIISRSGSIKGEIWADKIIVNGEIDGVCRANAIEILDKGVVSGSIYCDNLSIDRGGKFFGTTFPAETQHVVEFTPKGKVEEKMVKDTNESKAEQQKLKKAQ